MTGTCRMATGTRNVIFFLVFVQLIALAKETIFLRFFRDIGKPLEKIPSPSSEYDNNDDGRVYSNDDTREFDEKGEDGDGDGDKDENRLIPNNSSTQKTLPSASSSIFGIGTKNGTITTATTNINKNTARRPWMVVHVGPPKTGTSTIQTGFNIRAGDLATLDQVFYVGHTVKPRLLIVEYDNEHNNTDNSSGTEPKTFSVYQLRDFVLPRRPNPAFVRDMLEHWEQGHNIILSSEHYTSKISTSSSRLDSYFEIKFDYTFLRDGGRAAKAYLEWSKKNGRVYGLEEGEDDEELKDDDKGNEEFDDDNDYDDDVSQRSLQHLIDRSSKILTKKTEDESSTFGFDVSVIVTYRHFFQWLPSYYYQSVLINQRNGRKTRIDYIEKVLSLLPEEYFDDTDGGLMDWPYGNTTDSKLPDLGLVHGSLYSYVRWSSQPSLRDRVLIFDMHQQELKTSKTTTSSTGKKDQAAPDLFRNFVCQALPVTATKTCALMSQENEGPLVERVRNQRDGVLSSLETGILTSTQEKQILLSARERLSLSLKGAQIRRRFQEWVENRNAQNITGSDGHRELCLSLASLDKLKKASWNMLRHLEYLVRQRTARVEQLPKGVFEHPFPIDPDRPFLLSPPPTDHENTGGSSGSEIMRIKWESLKKAHDDGFEDAVNNGAYCELDIDRLFHDESFVRNVVHVEGESRTRRWRRKNEKKNRNKHRIIG